MNHLAIPTLLLAAALFGLGLWRERQKVSGHLRLAQWLIAIAVAVPGIVFTVYYLKVFTEPIWLYLFRTVPYSELTAGGPAFWRALSLSRSGASRGFTASSAPGSWRCSCCWVSLRLI